MDKLLSLSGNGLSEIVNNIDRWTSLRDNWAFNLTEEEEDKVRDALATLPKPYKLNIHASTNLQPKSEEKPIVLASLMAMGTNIGLTKMANAAQWRMYDDAMNRVYFPNPLML
ncbi:Tn3 family transposase [Brevibacillus sp. Leaf182]|uniref:Tn3 family transposase n=1 Tax=Brevibacillus sp. Leaf182 TaxID=1736290 RepID=UPI0006F530C8|nr:hypothetical protein ASG16_027870 [Brevibacillus sp. Leaf182]